MIDRIHMRPQGAASHARASAFSLIPPFFGWLPAALFLALACGADASTRGSVHPYDSGASSVAASAQDPAPAGGKDQEGEKQTPEPEKKTGDEPVLPPGLGKDDGPRLEHPVNTQTHNFGSLMQGAVAKHTFELTAKGNAPLEIKSVKPTCGCTVAQVLVENEKGEMAAYVFGEQIPVGRKVQVPAELHTKGKQGHQNTRINIFSNDPRGQVQLGLEADIQTYFNVNPRFLNFGTMQLGQVQTQQAVVSTSTGEPITLTMMDPAVPAGMKTELVALDPDPTGKSSRWQLTVTLGPELVEGNMARAVQLQSDRSIPGSETAADVHADGTKHTEGDGHDHGTAPQFYEASVTVSAQVVGPFTYQPNYLSMGLVRPGQVVARTIRVDSHDENYRFAEKQPKLRIAGLPVPGGTGYQDWNLAQYFTTLVRPVEGSNSIDVELTLQGMPEDATGSFRGTLVIELGHTDKQEIALTITGVCRGGPIPPRPDLPKTDGEGQ